MSARCGGGSDVAGLLGLAVDDVVELDQRRLGGAVAAHLVAHLDEHELAGAALPWSTTSSMVDVRVDAVADAHRRAELELAAGPHAPRQRHRRQEAAALGVAVGADLAIGGASAGSTASATAAATPPVPAATSALG